VGSKGIAGFAVRQKLVTYYEIQFFYEFNIMKPFSFYYVQSWKLQWALTFVTTGT